MEDIVKIVKEEQEKGNILLINFKDGSKIYVKQKDEIKSISDNFVFIEADSLVTGQRTKYFVNIRELKKIVVKEPINK